MTRYCANCGTEVEDSAVFCPTCGQPIDQATETEIPPAPAWPDQASEAPSADAPQPRHEEPTRVEEEAPPPPTSTASPQPTQQPTPNRPTPAPINLPVTMPLTLSAWLIGGGAAVAALGIIIGLFDGFLNPVDLILLVALIGIAVTVFFSSSVPTFANLRLITLVVVLLAAGIALDRIGFGGAGIGKLLYFLGAAAAAIGAMLLELGRDQPLGGPGR